MNGVSVGWILRSLDDRMNRLEDALKRLDAKFDTLSMTPGEKIAAIARLDADAAKISSAAATLDGAATKLDNQ